MNVIYLDYNATTPIREEVREAMLPYLECQFGNPSSAHAYGREPARAVARAREQLSDLLGCRPDEIVFTGSARHAAGRDPSPVLTATGLPREVALGAVRFSLGRSTTEAEVGRAAALTALRVTQMRGPA